MSHHYLSLVTVGIIVSAVAAGRSSGINYGLSAQNLLHHYGVTPSTSGRSNRSWKNGLARSSLSGRDFEIGDYSDCDRRQHGTSRTSHPSPFRPDVQQVSANGSKIARNLARGAILRIASDITGGTPLESIKTRVTVTKDNMCEAYSNIVKDGGIGALWSGTPSRTVEGALMGALFLAGSSGTKKFVLSNGGGATLAALCAGFVGGIAQTIVMTPAGMVFTSLNVNRGTPGFENENFLTVTQRIMREKGIMGMFAGGKPMAVRQATNWASRAGFTEIARTQFRMSRYGIIGEITAGAIGGVGSCWNTPVETVRVLTQRDVSQGNPPKRFVEYAKDIVERDGVPGLFRGVTPRAIQAIWQTAFMVVVPNILGV